MSILLGALGGAGDAAQRYGQQQQKTWDEEELMRQRADLETERTKTLEAFKSELAVKQSDSMRQALVDRTNKAATPLLQQALADKANKFYTTGDGAVASSNLTADDLSDEEKARFALNDSEKIDVMKKAWLSTGDLSLKDAMADDARQMGLEQKFAALDTRTQIANLVNDAKNAKTEAESAWRMAALESNIAKAGAGNTDFDKKIALLKESGASPADIASFITDRKQKSVADYADGYIKADPNFGTPRAMTQERAFEMATRTKQLEDALRNPSTKADSPKPAASDPLGIFPKKK